MRFSSSLVVFVYLGFVAAAVIPVVPKPTTVSTTALPTGTPDLDARNGVKVPGTSVPPVPVPVPTSTGALLGGNGGKGGKKGDPVARRGASLPGVGNLPVGAPGGAAPVPSLPTSLPVPVPSLPA